VKKKQVKKAEKRVIKDEVFGRKWIYAAFVLVFVVLVVGLGEDGPTHQPVEQRTGALLHAGRKPDKECTLDQAEQHG